jgi:hypothetical protein
VLSGFFFGGQEPVGLGNRRLQTDRSGPFFTAFLPHSSAMGLQIRQKLSSLGPLLSKPLVFAVDAPSPTGSLRSLADTTQQSRRKVR